MKKLIVASSNQHKLEEIQEMLPGLEILGLSDIGFDEEIDENGSTFAQNALIKAQAIYDKYHLPVLADDSGLCIDYFDGAPGVLSARYLGHDTSYEYKNNHILNDMKDVPWEKRGAQYVCAMAYINREGKSTIKLGVCDGYIALKVEGEKGFGYDPIFYVDDYQTTLANVSAEDKNKISHRHRALMEVKNEIEQDNYSH